MIFYTKSINELTPKQVIRIAKATYENSQIYESFRVRESLEPVFQRFIDIIPEYIIRHLEYNEYKFTRD